jgi:anti-sigma regulatory factor (Ser/Thr protein kinase)
MVSAMRSGVEIAPDRVVVRFTGALDRRAVVHVRRILRAYLVRPGRVIVDVSEVGLEWPPGVDVFPAVLTAAGGWPVACLVLCGPNARMREELEARGVPPMVPVVGEGESAERCLLMRPTRVYRQVLLPPDLGAPRAAREFLRQTCAAWADEACVPAAAVVVTELVTNVVEHAGTPCRLGLALDRSGFEVSVRDFRPGPAPRPRPRPVEARRGRGLHLVASLAHEWDAVRHTDGKTVWVRLAGCRGEGPDRQA